MDDGIVTQLGLLDRIAQVVRGTLAIDLDELERIVQEAHECARNQKEDPEERFPVSRQALRMFWRFRMHLDSVDTPLPDCGGERG
jgi:hypothetical protein